MIFTPALLFALAWLPIRNPAICQTQTTAATTTAKAGTGEADEAGKLTQQTITLFNQGKYAEALPVAERALELRRKVASKDDPLLAAALFNLASVEYSLRQFTKAVPLYEEALKIYEKKLGPDDPKLSSALEQLAWASYAINRPSNTEKYMRRSIEIKEKTSGPNSAEVASSVNLLGRYYEKIGNFQAAMSQYQRALAIMKEAKGPRSSEVATELDRCACVYTETGDTEQAADFRKRAGEIKADLDPDRPHLVEGQYITGRAIHREEPVYPTPAKQSHIIGTVVVEVHIDKTGKVAQVKQLCGPDIFAEVSMEAARKWVFAPTMVDSLPVNVIGTITFHFQM